MKGRRSRSVALAALAALASLGGCSETTTAKRQGAGGSGGTGATTAGSGGGAGSAGASPGGASSGAGAGSGGSSAGLGGSAGFAGAGAGAGSGGMVSDPCPELRAPLRTDGSLLELSTELTLGTEPLVFGEPNSIDGGKTLLPLDIRFYLSQVALIRPDESTVDVDIVTDSGAVIPFGVQLVNAEDAESLRFRVLAPPGSYAGVAFTLGVSDECNTGFPGSGPFSAASGMTWPHGFGYLFLRYAGLLTGPDAGAAPRDAGEGGAAGDTGTDDADPPSAIHMGGIQSLLLAPRLQARGQITIVAGAPTLQRLSLDFAEALRAAGSSLDVSDFPLPPDPEILAGERLRRAAPELALFSLSSP